MEKSRYGVHQSHCCLRCGCKYSDKDCPVVLREIRQDYLCEDCHLNKDDIQSVDELQLYGVEQIKLYPTIVFKQYMNKTQARRVLKKALASPASKHIEFSLRENKSYDYFSMYENPKVKIVYDLIGYVKGATEEYAASPQGFYL